MNNENERRPISIITIMIGTLLTIGLITMAKATADNFLFATTETYVKLRFDNVNEGNIVYFISDKKDQNVFKLNGSIVASIGNETISVNDEYLKKINLYGYVGPITLMEDMSTYNDGKAYYSNAFKVTIDDDIPVEFIHNLASSNRMDVTDQQDKTFTLVFRKELPLTEYKDKMDEFKMLNEVSSVKKIYLTMEDADDTNDQQLQQEQ